MTWVGIAYIAGASFAGAGVRKWLGDRFGFNWLTVASTAAVLGVMVAGRYALNSTTSSGAKNLASQGDQGGGNVNDNSAGDSQQRRLRRQHRTDERRRTRRRRRRVPDRRTDRRHARVDRGTIIGSTIGAQPNIANDNPPPAMDPAEAMLKASGRSAGALGQYGGAGINSNNQGGAHGGGG